MPALQKIYSCVKMDLELWISPFQELLMLEISRKVFIVAERFSAVPTQDSLARHSMIVQLVFQVKIYDSSNF
jgi:hypothetical protein